MAKLLKVPIEQYNNVIQLLGLDSYGELLRSLDRRGQRQLSSAIIQNIIDHNTHIGDEENVDKVTGWTKPRKLSLNRNLKL